MSHATTPTQGPSTIDCEVLTDIHTQSNLAEVEVISLVQELIPRYRLRVDTDFACSNEDFIQTPRIDGSEFEGLTNTQIRGLLDYYASSSDRISQMTKTYHDISAVTRMLEDRENDLQMAVTLGHNLLESNKSLRSQVTLLEQDIEQTTEIVKQLKHDLVLKERLIRFYSDLEENELQSVAANNFDVQHYEQKIRNLEDENQELRTEMLSSYYLHQTTRRLIIISIRATLSTSPYPKVSEIQITHDGIPTNYLKQKKKLDNDNIKSISLNDLLEIKQLDKTSLISNDLYQDTKVSSTFILSGIPIHSNVSSLTNEQHTIKKEQHHERIPSSRFSAFLRSIRSGLPFFPSKKNKESSMNITTTREHFIPLTRPSLIRLIASDNQLVDNDDDRLVFHQLCEGFDSAVVQRYHPILNELKNLFKPLNPDNEIIDHYRISYRDRLDNEYWLLEKIDDLLHRSNFTELPRNILLEKFIIQDNSSSSTNVNIKINGDDYDVLKFWILGREQIPIEQLSRWKKLFFRKSNSLISNDYFKRIILAVRLKGQDRLYLKAFRDIPLQYLPQLLPIGKLQIGQFAQRLIWFTFFIAT
ncbi:unnamed protein product, partial [Rotaria sp. Silwood1]